jgi:serine/threonine protein kinase
MINLANLKLNDIPLDNHYRLLERIGGGGFSDVWLAHDLRSRVDVILKVYASSQELDEEGVKMFRKEFSLVCNLNHTNILKPFTFDIFQGSPYIVLPYCKRGSASQLIGKISEEELWEFTAQVAAGLAYLHQHSIIHQDIKPANVLINSDNQYLITDFGISTGLRNTMRRSKSADDDTSGAGTTAYMSCECMGPQPTNVIARDIWAFGATLFELATGDVPYGEYGGLTQRSMGGKMPKITASLSADMKSLILKCLAMNPWDRPGADEILKWVEDHKKGIPVPKSKSLIWSRIAVSGIAIAVIFTAIILWMRPEPTSIPLNTNDSIVLARVHDAQIMVETECRNPIDSIDEQKLCRAVDLYRDAIALPATDTILTECRMMWTSSQTQIDSIYSYLSDKMIEYNEMGAAQAASKFAQRCEVLKGCISLSNKSIE